MKSRRRDFGCVHKETPNKIVHLLKSDADVRPPIESTPVLYATGTPPYMAIGSCYACFRGLFSGDTMCNLNHNFNRPKIAGEVDM